MSGGEPYYSDESVTLWHGDALTVLTGMRSGSVDCVVTSPPYFGLRDYGVDGQIGLETSPGEYVELLRAVFAEVRRVLADDGTLWLNLGDSYTASLGQRKVTDKAGPKQQTKRGSTAAPSRFVEGLAPKNLLGMPWRVAFALQDDGWTLRNAVVWHKPNAMPESVTDRLSNRYEPVFLFSKSRRYWFDLDSIKSPPGDSRNNAAVSQRKYAHMQSGINVEGWQVGHVNPGDVWAIPTSPFSAAHFATFPVALAERCIQAGCKPDGTVLDPFSGSGTTGLAAAKHGRRYVGIDLNREYLDLSLRTRLAQTALIEDVTA